MSELISQWMILLLGHGSRAPEATSGMEHIGLWLKERYGVSHLLVCHMEGLGLNLEQALEQVYKEGFRRILILPFFLHAGNHLLKDIPAVVETYRERFLDAQIHLGRHLGADMVLAELVFRRLCESLEDIC